MRISHSARFRSAGGLFILFGMLLSWPAFGQAYTIELTDRNASGWFGGDDRANGPRHVGNGQDVLIDADMRVESFSMYITGDFDFSANPDGYGHAVTIKMNVRNDQGEVISTHSANLPDTFAGDWVLFDDLDVEAASGTTLIFTWYLVGALDPATQYTSGYGANADDPYQAGSAWGKHGSSDEDMEAWTGWVRNSSWDAVFIVSGQQIQITDTEDDPGVVRDLRLDPAYPNPFNPSTSVTYALPESGHLRLSVFDATGREVAVLVDAFQPAGVHHARFSGANLPSGVYSLRLSTGSNSRFRSLVLLK